MEMNRRATSGHMTNAQTVCDRNEVHAVMVGGELMEGEYCY